MTAPRNRRRGEPSRLGPLTEPALQWVAIVCAALLLSTLTRGWWSAGACLVGLVAVGVLGALASERTPSVGRQGANESQVYDRRTGLPVEEGPWS